MRRWRRLQTQPMCICPPWRPRAGVDTPPRAPYHPRPLLPCPGGGIGRRAGFRCQFPKGSGSSSLLLGTTDCLDPLNWMKFQRRDLHGSALAFGVRASLAAWRGGSSCGPGFSASLLSGHALQAGKHGALERVVAPGLSSSSACRCLHADNGLIAGAPACPLVPGDRVRAGVHRMLQKVSLVPGKTFRDDRRNLNFGDDLHVQVHLVMHFHKSGGDPCLQKIRCSCQELQPSLM